MFGPMQPILPQVSAQDMNGLQALLVLLSDPVQAKQRLDELHVAATVAKDSEQAAIAAHAESKKALDQTVLQLAETKAAMEQHVATHKRLQEWEREIKRREDFLTARGTEHAQHVTDTVAQMAERERAVGQREGRTLDREAIVTNRENALAAAKSEHDARVAKLKAAVG